jgi:hypothetical protein
LAIGEDGRDVLEDDSGFRKIDNIADGGTENGGVWHGVARLGGRRAGRKPEYDDVG